ncbi:MAG TPA: hypothetical protein VFL47_03175, partial [Flavisolibacter sp.]|nr:hypothetical protein [Flavisolibacter sp.]
VQVKYGLITPQEFLNRLSEKITNSRTQFNDTLSFTRMSKESAGRYKDEYNNVYEKGALIAACLDLYLLHLSNGNYGLRNLTYDLGVRFGKERYFNDDELFDEIGKLTYPEIKDFLLKYVQGSEPIPYGTYFGLAGVKFLPLADTKTVSFGGITPAQNDKGQLVVGNQSGFNAFGKSLGYQVGDILYSFNGAPVTMQSFWRVVDSLKGVLKEGQPFEVQIGRANAQGVVEPKTLKGIVTMVTVPEKNKLEFLPQPSAKQELVRQAWLTAKQPEVAQRIPAAPADVSTVDAIIKTTYEVISGPAGPRNWKRFHSLFLPEARMGASVVQQAGDAVFRSFTPTEYQQRNAPFFLQNGFFEEELGREKNEFGNLVQVRSAYQFRFTPQGKVEQRGVNYFTLVKAQGRWWISQLVWQDESNAAPLPAAMIR